MASNSNSNSIKKASTKLDNGVSWWHVPVGIAFAVLLFVLQDNARYAQDPLVFLIPNALLYTPFRALTHKMWDVVLDYEARGETPMIPIPEMQAADFTLEGFQALTENWRVPAVVRGLFANTTATLQWHTRDYVASHIGPYDVVMLERGIANGLENDRQAMYLPFQQAWPAILEDKYTPKYLFFPERSRSKKGNETSLFSNQGLKDRLNKMVRHDLDLDRIWKGFASETHTSYIGAQFIAGWGHPSMDSTTGSNWHCAPGNNWFVQVHGRKQWRFVDAKHSAWMHPQRDGVFTMATSSPNMIAMEKYIPVKYVDLEAGDMLYNPDFEWHAIRNYEGLSIGIPIRENNKTLAMQNNLQYAVLFFINKQLASLGITYGLQSHLKNKNNKDAATKK